MTEFSLSAWGGGLYLPVFSILFFLNFRHPSLLSPCGYSDGNYPCSPPRAVFVSSRVSVFYNWARPVFIEGSSRWTSSCFSSFFVLTSVNSAANYSLQTPLFSSVCSDLSCCVICRSTSFNAVFRPHSVISVLALLFCKGIRLVVYRVLLFHSTRPTALFCSRRFALHGLFSVARFVLAPDF